MEFLKEYGLILYISSGGGGGGAKVERESLGMG